MENKRKISTRDVSRIRIHQHELTSKKDRCIIVYEKDRKEISLSISLLPFVLNKCAPHND